MESVQLIGRVMEVRLDNPPVNALSARLRRKVADALSAALRDPEVKSIVIRGTGKIFSAGADITEFGQSPIDPVLTAGCGFSLSSTR